MRLSCSFAFNGNSVFCQCVLHKRKIAPASAHSRRTLQSLESFLYVNKNRVRTSPTLFLFTRDAIRTHDLPLRRRLLYPAELLGLGSRGFKQAFGFWGTCIIPRIPILTQKFFFASPDIKNLFCITALFNVYFKQMITNYEEYYANRKSN